MAEAENGSSGCCSGGVGVREVSVREFYNRHVVNPSSPLLVVDYRPEEAYDREHIAGAVNIPPGDAALGSEDLVEAAHNCGHGSHFRAGLSTANACRATILCGDDPQGAWALHLAQALTDRGLCHCGALHVRHSHFSTAFPVACCSRRSRACSDRGAFPSEIVSPPRLHPPPPPPPPTSTGTAAYAPTMFDTPEVTPLWEPQGAAGGLYLSGIAGSQNMRVLRGLGIAGVVDASCVPGAGTRWRHRGVRYLAVPEPDHHLSDLAGHFPCVCAFMAEIFGLGGSGGGGAQRKPCSVLVHCHVGASRSPALVMAYLMRAHGMLLADACDAVFAARPIAYVNWGFKRQLLRWQMELHGTRAPGLSSAELSSREQGSQPQPRQVGGGDTEAPSANSKHAISSAADVAGSAGTGGDGTVQQRQRQEQQPQQQAEQEPSGTLPEGEEARLQLLKEYAEPWLDALPRCANPRWPERIVITKVVWYEDSLLAAAVERANADGRGPLQRCCAVQ